MCGYKDFENIARLRQSLKGIAYDSVWPQLTMNGSVAAIMSTLKTLFGRPELIIKELLNEGNLVKPIKDENLIHIMNFAMLVQNLVSTVSSARLLDHLRNPCLLEELVGKLSANLKLQWGMHRLHLEEVSLNDFNQWLQELSLSARTVTNEYPKLQFSEMKSTNREVNNKRTFHNVHSDPAQSENCFICDSDCICIEKCDIFKGMTLKKRWDVVTAKQLCRCCLEPRHKSCPNERVCGVDGCSFRHHPLLHKNKMNDQGFNKEKSLVAVHDENDCSVLYRLAPVTIFGPHSEINTFAFLDDGSGLTLIDEDLAEELKLSGIKQPLCLTWTGNTSRLEANSQVVSLEISKINGKERFYMPNVHTVEKLGLPRQSLSSDYINQFEHLRKLPIVPYIKAKPKLLIGLKDWRLGIPLATYEGNSNEPICSYTRLGYVVCGPCSLSSKQSCRVNVHECECELHNLVNSYFSIENIGVIKSEAALIPAREKRALDILVKTTRRKGDRYETGLLWRSDDIKLPESIHMARKRMSCLQRKLNSDTKLKDAMNNQIADYILKGYIRELSKDEIHTTTSRTWYLPIFPVFNPNKPHKLRIVWDAAAKVNGVSLNSTLLTGPDQLSSLVGVLQRFRQEKFAISGDIAQMFHQVKICKQDQDSQRFLWFDKDGREVVYVMEVMTFGASCSPSCAQYIKNLNAAEFKLSCPRAFIAITKNHYVDDFLDSQPSEEELLNLANDVLNIHQHGGFIIRNRISNSRKVVDSLETGEINSHKNLNISEDVAVEKVLGLWWSTNDDVFKFNIKITDQNRQILNGDSIPTKRQLLSTIMRIFDPLGFLSNAMVYVKIILQEVWKSNIDWNDKILPDQFSKWQEWIQLIPKFGELSIPRWYFKCASPQNTELHVFVDGSLQAYSTVAYFRYYDGEHIRCSLVGAKSKIAPNKLISVPRIELMSALIGARFANSITTEHTIFIARRIFWSDSLTVLRWLHNDKFKFKQFVGFRIGEILELTKPCEWRYVPSKLNIADQATKAKIPEISSDSDWINGPSFLYEDEVHWPENIVGVNDSEMLELREVFLHKEHKIPNLVEFKRYSKWAKLCRYIGYVLKAALKWKKYKRSIVSEGIPKLDSIDLLKAEQILIRQCQYEAYPDEMIILHKVKDGETNMHLEKNSPIYKDTPYLDEAGVARRRGRIDAADTKFDVKRPILLPRNHYATDLIIRSYHEKFKHANDNSVINELLQKFVIPCVRVLLKTIRRTCQKCKNDRSAPQPPLMGDLPPSRLQSFTRPFTYVGADYFGPILVTVGRRTEKRWGMLLTCMTVRAIHIELASSLSTDSCIMCVNRFIARRGFPLEIISDNGTNFKGAANELQTFLQNEDNQKILVEKFTTATMTWKFITPGAPHMGGSWDWERLVRSVKTLLNNTTSPLRTPSPELLHTMLLEVESIINSRPLTHVGLENHTDEVITPNHFLIGSSSGSKAIGNTPEFYEDADGTVLRKEWMTAQQLANQFWTKWMKEYLPTLSKRTKWYEKTDPIKVGDVVVVLDELAPRNCWSKGLVLEVIKNKIDNQVRSAIVKTQDGIYKRPAVKLAVLDVKCKIPSPEEPLQGGTVNDGTTLSREESELNDIDN